jgi:hypothetical protein
MFSVITNIYNKKTKGPTLLELFTATGTLKKFFWQLEMFDVCTTGYTAHINTIFKFLPHTREHECIPILHCCNDMCLKARRSHEDSLWLLCNVHFVQSIRPNIATWPSWPKARIIAAVKNIDALMLKRVWQELEYHIDVCRVTRGAHMEYI